MKRRSIVLNKMFSGLGAAPPLRVGWLGPRSGGLAWLEQRLRDSSSLRIQLIELSTSCPQTIDDLPRLAELGMDRLIVACATRLDYPARQIQWLTTQCPEIPLALATDTWWEGARRTGLGPLPHVVLPWHRWWDGWLAWLEASSAELFGPCVVPASYSVQAGPQGTEPSRVRRGVAPPPSRGWIVADCFSTAAAWRLAAEQARASIELKNSASFVDAVLAPELAEPAAELGIDWLLWDDSCLTTAGGAPEVEQCLAFVELAQQHMPHTRLYCAFSIPRWSVWQRLQRAGVAELLTKPNTGCGLRRMLAEGN